MMLRSCAARAARIGELEACGSLLAWAAGSHHAAFAAVETPAWRIVAATGVSTIKFIQRRRLPHASHLIETTSMSIEAIAAEVGYQDGTALR